MCRAPCPCRTVHTTGKKRCRLHAERLNILTHVESQPFSSVSSIIQTTDADETGTMIRINRLSMLLLMAVNCYLIGTVVAVCTNPDTEPPQLTCPPPKKVIAYREGNECRYDVPPFFYPVPKDNCDVSLNITSPEEGAKLVSGINPITFQATDAAGNKVSCTWELDINTSKNCSCSAFVTFESIPIIGWLLDIFFKPLFCLISPLFGLAY